MNKNNNNNERLIINQKYYQDLSKFDILSEDELNDLFALIATGNTKASNIVIESNLKLVIYYAKQYKNYIKVDGVFDIDDLISEGNLGLIKSLNKFKPEMGVKFSYYSSYWIKKYIQDFLMNDVNQIRIPQNKIIAETKIKKEIDALYQKHQTEITDYEILNSNKFLVSEIKHFFNKPTANRIGNDEMFIQDDTTEDTTNENKHTIEIALKYLTVKERKVIKFFYGIDSETSLTIDEIAANLNLTRQRINEIKLNALAKMKTKITP
jgi:RNA polymerase primary sigma factor